MATPSKKEEMYKYIGRPTKLTPESVRKLEEAAAVRATVRESCFYAGISADTYYKWMKESPELLERLEDLRQKPFLVARKTIIDSLNDVNVAFRFLEKEKPEEYGDRIKVEHSGNVQQGDTIHPDDEALRLEFKTKLLANIRRRWDEKEKRLVVNKLPDGVGQKL